MTTYVGKTHPNQNPKPPKTLDTGGSELVLYWCDVLKLYTVRSGMLGESQIEILVKVVRCSSCSLIQYNDTV